MSVVTVTGRQHSYTEKHFADGLMTGMAANSTYTGTHMVVLPADYMNSIESAVEMHAEQIASVAANLEYPNLSTSPFRIAVRQALTSIAIWLAPVTWMICL